MTIYQDPELYAFLILKPITGNPVNCSIFMDGCIDATDIQASDRLVYHKE